MPRFRLRDDERSARASAVDPALAAAAALAIDAEAGRTEIIPWTKHVLVDEATQAPAALAPFHPRWLRALADPNERRVAVIGFVGSGKTSCAAAAASLIMCRSAAGLTPETPIIYCSASEAVAARFLRLVRSMIERGIEAGVFPELRGRLRWTSTTCDLERSTSRLSLLRVAGPGTRLLSLRGAVLVTDDAESAAEARFGSRDAKERKRSWRAETLSTRALNAASREWTIGSPFDKDDLLSETSRKPGWLCLPVPALDSTGESTWPARWPTRELMRVRAEVGESVWQRSYQLNAAAAASDSLFSPFAIDRALRLGRGMKSGDEYLLWNDPRERRWYSPPVEILSVDPAFSTASSADFTGIVIATTMPSGLRCVVETMELKVAPRDLVNQIVRLAEMWKPKLTVIEDNGPQRIVLETIRDLVPRLNCTGTTTTRATKWSDSEGLPKLAVNLERIWALPSDADGNPSPSSARMCEALRSCKASVEHHQSDLAMAMLFADQNMPCDVEADHRAIAEFLRR